MISLMTLRMVVMLLQGDGVHYADVDDVGFAGDGHADDVVVNDDWRFQFFARFSVFPKIQNWWRAVVLATT